jgi:hypothetical protein
MDYEQQIKELNDELFDMRDKLKALYTLATAVCDCGTMDVDAILDMEKHHNGTIDAAMDFAEEMGDSRLSFYAFVEGVLRVSLAEVDGFLDDLIFEVEEDERLKMELEAFKESIEQVSINAEYYAWGSLADYGYCELEGEALQRNHDGQEAFAKFVNGSYDIDEFMARVREIYGVKI